MDSLAFQAKASIDDPKITPPKSETSHEPPTLVV